MTIRSSTKADYDKVWKIFSEVIKTSDAYIFDPSTPKSDMKKHWFAPHMNTFIAEQNGEIQGTYVIKPNQIDLGNHIANCSYMVSPAAQGKGVGKLLCKHSIQFAKESGYRGIQFNIVVSTNIAAVALWKKFGFKIIGTTPGGFRHPKQGFVDTYIMFREL